MPIGKKYTPEFKGKVVARYNELGGKGLEPAKQAGKEFKLNAYTVYGWVSDARNGQKKTSEAIKSIRSKTGVNAKRKTAKRAVKARLSVETSAKEEREWDALFDNYIYHRDEAAKAKKELEDYVKGLK